MSVSENLSTVRQQIQQICRQFERENVRLLAVSKTKSIEAIEAAIAAGQTAFGENYVQEAIEKISYFNQQNKSKRLEWHFIGPLQSNKTRLVAENFDWLQTLDRLKIAERLNLQRPADLAPLNVLIQINISDEASKAGITPQQMMNFAEAINALPHLCLRGLMAIPKPAVDIAQQKAVFQQMQQLFDCLKAEFAQVDTLSMGMSDDMLSAIECGSTMVRIGTAIFGVRDYSAKAV
ncbi:hypothetical protein RZ60_01610 [[Haemophilus] ducreyi]|uniref:Pyridoxal phosphate homeostasis protein n=2 Tax=Haemophilus ducreyi TaxID=730 RepID=Q7VP13_HAEDU|nr:YggS family pyridoxal phosphate-dependent enzyme [[Haemophilus] ducreyi]AAP95277.1 K+ uptake protein [[Haemophilus] ducreyi 35000HP]AKO30410.1 hypothetical protein RY60_01135 [[Haemophilus] ducreyi]AKO31844.1 hypothetical protein RZ57_01135 [[Haemophilus] ducreyi]AKO33297.1 hypothetical protein RZ58_01140 [[Haemophilus] ducreyi]AKO34745.1 hypothetical protein RZ59_01125 [[Haemophilus] ducreyi]